MEQSKTLVIAVVGISGSGKSTLLKALLEHLLTKDILRAPVSATTRPKRSYETDGVDYHFMKQEDFQEGIAKGEFLEYEEVHNSGYLYGVLKGEVERILADNKSPITDVNIAGAFSLKEIYGDQAMLIWVDAPEEMVVRERLRKRGTRLEEIDRRMLSAKAELPMRERFETFVDNSGEDLRVAQDQIIEIIVRALRPLRLVAPKRTV